MKNWKGFSRLLIITFSSLLVLTGCKVTEELETTDIGVTDNVSQSSTTLRKSLPEDVSVNVVDCRGARKGQDKGNKHADKEKKICIAICHRPPGNPENGKSMILPMAAVLAHIKHGGPKHSHQDTMGPCEDDSDDDMDELDPDDPTYGNDDEDGDQGESDSDGDDGDDAGSDGDDGCSDHNSDESDSADDTADGDDGGNADEPNGDIGGDVGIGTDDPAYEDDNTPEYCLENLHIDADCDGLEDESGYPLY